MVEVRSDFAVGPEDKQERRRVCWTMRKMEASREAWSLHLVYHAEKPAVDAVEEIKIDKNRKNNAAYAPHLQTAYRSRPGQLTWL